MYLATIHVLAVRFTTTRIRLDDSKYKTTGFLPHLKPVFALFLVVDGPAVCLSWIPQHTTTCRVNEYEINRGARREAHALRLSGEIRTQIMLAHGHSWEEIDDCMSAAEQVRRNRFSSVCWMQWDFLALATESAGRKIQTVKNDAFKRVIQMASLAASSSSSSSKATPGNRNSSLRIPVARSE